MKSGFPPRKQKYEVVKQKVEQPLDAEERAPAPGFSVRAGRNLEGFAQSVKVVMKETSRVDCTAFSDRFPA